MSLLPLQNLTIIDLSYRLPGPYCGKLLSDLGANVLKIEDVNHGDQFYSGALSKDEPLFKKWYQVLNQNKKEVLLDFSSNRDQDKLKEIILNADGLLYGLPEKIKTKLQLESLLKNQRRSFVSIEFLASKTQGHFLHDLNALAKSGLLQLHIKDRIDDIISPPFLPFAGLNLGIRAALNFTSHYLYSLKNNSSADLKMYLDETTSDSYSLFWPNEDRSQNMFNYLHNGAFPCYSIYKTKDQKYFALAAIENKFWSLFCSKFKLDQNLDRFYNQDQSVFQIISFKFKSLNAEEILEIMGSDELCLTII